ncbi:hypothetical protein AALP_AA8G148100 [Arabis alpina]|uniref:FBD domain-containing protein n=1 Tax=Arabis alpina TaxID=50452 RepID=A0A087G752_ARAAL|nr:hypothetical protein AALP_AA8G148100 [Arabis alpina]
MELDSIILKRFKSLFLLVLRLRNLSVLSLGGHLGKFLTFSPVQLSRDLPFGLIIVMTFDNPNLIYLGYSGYLQLQYPLVNLDSLVKAKLEIAMNGGDPGSCDPSNLIKGLRNVKILSLIFPKTVEIFGKFHEAVPVFENLIRLSIKTVVDFCSSLLSLPSLPFLLTKCPNLQTLVIEGPLCCHDTSELVCHCFTENSCILSSPAKVLELTEYKGSTRELGQIKRFLEELSCLELVKVCASAEDDKEKLRITTDLLMLPRASSQCKIQVQFS